MKYHIIRLENTDSTNQYALDLLDKGPVTEGTIIITENQTAGRGVDGNNWESEPGKNLTFSLVIHPEYLSVESQFYLNKVFSLSIFDLVKKRTGEVTRIKWPNDVYVEKGKIAGILIHNGIQGNRFTYCIAGIGLNVNQERFSPMEVSAVSLKIATGKKYDLDFILEELCENISERLGMLSRGDWELIDHDYHSVLYRLDERAGYLYHGKKIKAKITGVDKYGHLLLETTEHKSLKCDLKEVKFII